MSQFNGTINSSGNMLTPQKNLFTRVVSPLSKPLFMALKSKSHLAGVGYTGTPTYWLYGKHSSGRAYDMEKGTIKTTGDQLTWDDFGALDIDFGTSNSLRFVSAQAGYNYAYYVDERRFIVRNDKGVIVHEVATGNAADFSVSWDLFCSANTTIYYRQKRKESVIPADNTTRLMYGDRQYADLLDKKAWRSHRIVPKGEDYRVRYLRIYGDELIWKQLRALNLTRGNATQKRYTSLQSGWRYVYRPQDLTFTVYDGNSNVDSQIKTTVLSEFGIVWEIFSSHQFYIEWEYWVFDDHVEFDSNMKSDGTTSATFELTVAPDYEPLRGKNPIREINARYNYKLYRFTKESGENVKIYGDEMVWAQLQAASLIRGDNDKLIFPAATPGYEYFYKPYDEMFMVKNADGDTIYTLSTNELSEFGMPWSIFSSHQFYIWYHTYISNDMYLSAKRKRTRQAIISLEKYIIALISAMLATISNRNNPVYEPWMLWKVWQWLGESSEEAVYCFDIMPNWGG